MRFPFTRRAADDVTLDVLETIDLSAWQPAILESETVDAPGLLRATWRSQSAGPKCSSACARD